MAVLVRQLPAVAAAAAPGQLRLIPAARVAAAAVVEGLGAVPVADQEAVVAVVPAAAPVVAVMAAAPVVVVMVAVLLAADFQAVAAVVARVNQQYFVSPTTIS